MMFFSSRTSTRRPSAATFGPGPAAAGPGAGRADQLRGLRLHLTGGAEDLLHPLRNDLMIAQHPCGDAPLVGAQLRYLIGSEHGWLGALGLGPAAFLLPCRDQWTAGRPRRAWGTCGR